MLQRKRSVVENHFNRPSLDDSRLGVDFDTSVILGERDYPGYWNGGLGNPVALREERTYNVLGQMLTQAVRKGNSVDVKWRITNEYGLSGNNGNLNKQSTETGTATYGVRYVYDGANRIRGAAEGIADHVNLPDLPCASVGGTWCVKYRVNGFGNAWTENKSQTAAGLTPLAETSFEAFTNRLLGASYYANGFQKSLVLNDTQSRAEYDADGRLRKAGRVTTANGVVWDASQLLTENTYNGAGQRVKRTVTQGPATSTIHYVYGLDGEVASEWESSSTTVTGRQFLVGDQLGSTRVRFDANGEVLQRIDYEPYGGEVQRTGVSGYSGANEVKQKFTGKERDSETGLDYFGARYMAAAMGRFTSPDEPLVDQQVEDARSWNLFSYVRSNPMSFVDPSGQTCLNAKGEIVPDSAGSGAIGSNDDGKGCLQAGVAASTVEDRRLRRDIKPHGTTTNDSASRANTADDDRKAKESSEYFLGPRFIVDQIKQDEQQRQLEGPQIKATPPRPRLRNTQICISAPAFLLANPELFGLKSSSRPADPLNSEDVPPIYQPKANKRSGSYSIGGSGSGGRRELNVNSRFAFLGLFSDYRKCVALIEGQQ